MNTLNTLSTPSVNDLADFEGGQLTETQATALFQRLVDTGIAWQLNKAYRSTAEHLIEQGRVHPTYH